MLDDVAYLPTREEIEDLWDRTSDLLLSWAEEVLRAVGWTEVAEQRPALAVGLAAALGLLLLLIFIGVRRRWSGGPYGVPLAGLTRRPRTLGYAAVLVLLASLGGWASIAPLASAALAPAVVSPDGYRKTIQHLEGGIVQAIHVREGDSVVAGHELVTLDKTQARARHRELRERYAHLLAMEARLTAEQVDADEISTPDEFAGMADINGRRALDGQAALLQSRRATRDGREQILGQRIRQLEEEIAGLREVISAQDRQIALIEQEIVGVQMLYDKGLERLPRLLALRRAKAEIEAEKAANRAKIARNGQEIGETRIQLLTMGEQENERVNEELTKVSASLAELRSQLASREDVLTRTVIRAPISGTVMNLRVTTETGVIGSGEPILDIVPTGGKLIIDAQVKPIDIDNVRPGMTARVLLTAYRQRNLPQIYGVLRSVSADRLVEDRSGNAYFLAKVEVDPDDLAELEDVRLMPGMPAEVMILIGERTVLDYLLRPLVESITKSFRES